MKHSFHAHHAPMGGCGSFLLGLNGTAGGFVASAGAEGAQDVFVGYRYAGESWTLLPFVREATARAAGSAITLLPHGRYGRTLGWASDRWMAQALVFSIATPFESISASARPDAERTRLLLTPAAYALLDFDNSHMDIPVDLVFAIGDAMCAWRAIDGAGDGSGLAGFVAHAASTSFAATAATGVRVFADAEMLGVRAAGLVFQLPAAGKGVFPIALGLGDTHSATLATALAQFAEARALATKRDDELRASGLGDDARRRLSLGTRTHLAAGPIGTAAMDLSLAAMRSLARV